MLFIDSFYDERGNKTKLFAYSWFLYVLHRIMNSLKLIAWLYLRQVGTGGE